MSTEQTTQIPQAPGAPIKSQTTRPRPRNLDSVRIQLSF